MLCRVKRLRVLHQITDATRKLEQIVGLKLGAYRHYSDSNMSRVIPNKKQPDAKPIESETFCDDDTQTRMDHFPQRGLNSYKPTMLFRCDNYLVIDKPPGVRMNGDFEGSDNVVAVYCLSEEVSLKLCYKIIPREHIRNIENFSSSLLLYPSYCRESGSPLVS